MHCNVQLSETQIKIWFPKPENIILIMIMIMILILIMIMILILIIIINDNDPHFDYDDPYSHAVVRDANKDLVPKPASKGQKD